MISTEAREGRLLGGLALPCQRLGAGRAILFVDQENAIIARVGRRVCVCVCGASDPGALRRLDLDLSLGGFHNKGTRG